MVAIRHERPEDGGEIGRLLNLGFAPSHAKRNIWSLRRGAPVAELCLVAEDEDGHLAGSIRYWPITIAGEASLLLGPLAVDPALRGQGIGRQLVLKSIDLARQQGHWHWCFVSGERDYYPKLGFSKLKPMISTFRRRLKKNACISSPFRGIVLIRCRSALAGASGLKSAIVNIALTNHACSASLLAFIRSRFCRLMLAEKKLDALQKLEPWWERPKGFLAINPAGTVPVLVEDDGTVLCGVWPIAEYFEDAMPETSLLPGTPAARAEARRLVDLFQGKFEREVVGPILREKLLRRLTDDGVPSSTVIRTALANLGAHLEYLNYLLERRKWLAGTKISLADLHAAASLSVVDFLVTSTGIMRPRSELVCPGQIAAVFQGLLADTVTGLTPPAHYTDLDF